MVEQKRLDLTKAEKINKPEENKKMPDNTVIIGNFPLMKYLWSVNNYMCGENYNSDKGINVQWDEAHEGIAKTFIDVNLNRAGFFRNAEVKKMEFDDIEKIGRGEKIRHRIVFVQNVKLFPALLR